MSIAQKYHTFSISWCVQLMPPSIMALGPCDAFIYAFIYALNRHRHQRESVGSVVDNKNGRSRHLLLLMCTRRFHPAEPPPIWSIRLFAQKKSFQQLPPLDFHSLCGPRLPWLGCFRPRRHSAPKWRNQLCVVIRSPSTTSSSSCSDLLLLEVLALLTWVPIHTPITRLKSQLPLKL